MVEQQLYAFHYAEFCYLAEINTDNARPVEHLVNVA